MPKLSEFRQDSRAIVEGEWVPVPEYGDLEILTRGFTDAYTDARDLAQRRAAQGMGGDMTKLPAAVRRGINIETLIRHCLRDVRNLTHDSGEPVSFAEFCNLLRDPDYESLVVACLSAAGKVGLRRGAEVEDAAGPLSLP